MTPARTPLAFIAGLAATACLAFPAATRSAELPHRMFACSLGRKSVSVTSDGNWLTYRFGRPGRPEISITGSAATGNVLYRVARYASMEYQLRFVSGQYSYTVYSMDSNDATGSSAASGLMVRRGTKVMADLACKPYAELDLASGYSSLPEDTAEYTAM